MISYISGPMAERDSKCWKSMRKKEGAHYNIYDGCDGASVACLKELFPKGEANELNFCLFSTSGIHGTYTTIEEIEQGLMNYPDGPQRVVDDDWWPDDYHGDELTFLVVHPRIVCVRFGNVKVCLDDIEYLKKLRASSHRAVQSIGQYAREDEEEAT